MKAKLSLLILLFCSVTMTAETYSIVFKSGNGSSDSGTKVNELTKIILSATDNCVESVEHLQCRFWKRYQGRYKQCKRRTDHPAQHRLRYKHHDRLRRFLSP